MYRVMALTPWSEERQVVNLLRLDTDSDARDYLRKFLDRTIENVGGRWEQPESNTWVRYNYQDEKACEYWLDPNGYTLPSAAGLQSDIRRLRDEMVRIARALDLGYLSLDITEEIGGEYRFGIDACALSYEKELVASFPYRNRDEPEIELIKFAADEHACNVGGL